MINYSIIAAVSENSVIGDGNLIPWHISEDLQMFKRLTSGNILIMGRKTFDSIGKPLPGRTTIVLTRSADAFHANYPDARVLTAASIEEALETAEKEAEARSSETGIRPEIFIAGGAAVYRQSIEKAGKLYISRIHGEYEGDAFFPDFPKDEWCLTSEEKHKQFTLEIYVRKKISVLFLCTGNSCRSQMAEGWAKELKSDSIDAFSAGIEKHGLNPNAVKVMKEAGIDISEQKSKTTDELRQREFDYVVTVCSHANENCPWFPAKTRLVHVGFDDPPRLAENAGTEEEALGHYRRVRDEIREYILTLPESLF